MIYSFSHPGLNNNIILKYQATSSASSQPTISGFFPTNKIVVEATLESFKKGLVEMVVKSGLSFRTFNQEGFKKTGGGQVAAKLKE